MSTHLPIFHPRNWPLRVLNFDRCKKPQGSGPHAISAPWTRHPTTGAANRAASRIKTLTIQNTCWMRQPDWNVLFLFSIRLVYIGIVYNYMQMLCLRMSIHDVFRFWTLKPRMVPKSQSSNDVWDAGCHCWVGDSGHFFPNKTWPDWISLTALLLVLVIRKLSLDNTCTRTCELSL